MAKITVKLTDTTAGTTETHHVHAQPSEPFETTAARLVRRISDLPRHRSVWVSQESADAYGQPTIDVTADGRTYRVAKVQR